MNHGTRIRWLLVLVLFAGEQPALAQLDAGAARPPVAKKVPKTTTIHGETLIDNYSWLREKSNKEVLAYLNAENAYVEAVMKPTENFQAALYKEMVGRIEETDQSAPYRQGDWWYYSRTAEGKQYPIHCRKRGSLDAKEEIVLDLNAAGRAALET